MAWKHEVRVIGFDDGPSTVDDEDVDIVGVVTRAGPGYVEAVLHGTVRRDGDDATTVLAGLVNGCRLKTNLAAILTQNVMVAGFNTIDVWRLHEQTGIPVIAVIRGLEDWDAVRRALVEGHIPGGAAKWQRIAGCPEAAVQRRKTVFIPIGLDAARATDLVDLATLRGHMPEPLRLAHLIAAGWVLGESKGQ